MGLVTLFMFCSNCLLGAHGYAIDGFCGFLGSCFVPIACYRREQLPPHGIWGCATSIIGFLFYLSSRSSLSSRAQEGILAIRTQMIILVVDKGNLLGKGMTVIMEGLLRLRPVTTVIGSRNSKLRPPHSNASTRGDAAVHLN